MKIGLCGTMSVGKTTIIDTIRTLNLLPDYNLFTERSKKLMLDGVPLNDKSTYKGQLVFFAERAKELMKDNMITDRTALDVWAFSLASDDIAISQMDILTDIYSSIASEYDLIIYIPPIVEMEDNGVRETDLKYRKLIDKTIKGIFEDYSGEKHELKATDVLGRVDEILLKIEEMK